MSVSIFSCRYILSLALGDLLVLLISVPFTSVVYTVESWPWGELVCKISETAQDVSVGVSVFTLTALSADRFFAIVDPLKKLHTSSKFVNISRVYIKLLKSNLLRQCSSGGLKDLLCCISANLCTPVCIINVFVNCLIFTYQLITLLLGCSFFFFLVDRKDNFYIVNKYFNELYIVHSGSIHVALYLLAALFHAHKVVCSFLAKN